MRKCLKQTDAESMDKRTVDKDTMFNLLSSYDYQLGEAVEEIERLRKLVVEKKMEKYGYAWTWRG